MNELPPDPWSRGLQGKELDREVLALVEAGHSTREISGAWSVSQAWVGYCCDRASAERGL